MDIFFYYKACAYIAEFVGSRLFISVRQLEDSWSLTENSRWINEAMFKGSHPVETTYNGIYVNNPRPNKTDSDPNMISNNWSIEHQKLWLRLETSTKAF